MSLKKSPKKSYANVDVINPFYGTNELGRTAVTLWLAFLECFTPVTDISNNL